MSTKNKCNCDRENAVGREAPELAGGSALGEYVYRLPPKTQRTPTLPMPTGGPK